MPSDRLSVFQLERKCCSAEKPADIAKDDSVHMKWKWQENEDVAVISMPKDLIHRSLCFTVVAHIPPDSVLSYGHRSSSVQLLCLRRLFHSFILSKD